MPHLSPRFFSFSPVLELFVCLCSASLPFDEVVETRICSLPTKAAANIYDKLGYRHYPFRKMKICST